MRKLDDTTYEISSRSTEELYTLRIDPVTKEPSCSCKGYRFGGYCYHIDKLTENFPDILNDINPDYVLRRKHTKIKEAIIKATEAVDHAFQLVDSTMPVLSHYVRNNRPDIDSLSSFPKPSGSSKARLVGVRNRLESAALSLRGDSVTKKLQDVRSEIAKSWSHSSDMMKALDEAFAVLRGNGPAIAENQAEMPLEEPPAGRDAFSIAGKTFVVTGTLSACSRREAENRIKSLGGSVSSSVTRKTDYLVVGESPGSKLDAAQRLGTEVLEEAAFLEFLETASTGQGEPVETPG